MKQNIDIEVLRDGKQVSGDHCRMLTTKVTEEEVNNALKKISDITAPGIDGYGAKFYKACWHIIRKDSMEAIVRKVGLPYV